MTPADLRAELERRVARFPSQRYAAHALGISQSQICMVLRGDCEIGRTLAEKLGYRKVVTFEPLETK